MLRLSGLEVHNTMWPQQHGPSRFTCIHRQAAGGRRSPPSMPECRSLSRLSAAALPLGARRPIAHARARCARTVAAGAPQLDRPVGRAAGEQVAVDARDAVDPVNVALEARAARGAAAAEVPSGGRAMWSVAFRKEGLLTMRPAGGCVGCCGGCGGVLGPRVLLNCVPPHAEVARPIKRLRCIRVLVAASSHAAQAAPRIQAQPPHLRIVESRDAVNSSPLLDATSASTPAQCCERRAQTRARASAACAVVRDAACGRRAAQMQAGFACTLAMRLQRNTDIGAAMAAAGCSLRTKSSSEFWNTTVRRGSFLL